MSIDQSDISNKSKKNKRVSKNKKVNDNTVNNTVNNKVNIDNKKSLSKSLILINNSSSSNDKVILDNADSLLCKVSPYNNDTANYINTNVDTVTDTVTNTIVATNDITNIVTNVNNNTINKENICDSLIGVKKERDILVLSGGSTKGVAQLGAMHCLKKYGMLSNVKIIAATSVGSMNGLLYSIGYQPLELYKFLRLVDFERVKNIDIHNVITKYGLDDGSRMIFIIRKLMSAKEYDPDITFVDLHAKTGITFIVSGACINDKKVYYFSHINNPNMKVIDAVRISTAFPIAFTPFMYDGKMFIDGACIDNFPIHLFNNEIDRVVGIYVAECRKIVNEIKNIEDYLINMMECLFEGVVYRDTNNTHKCVIVIKCTKTSDSLSDMANMFDEGYLAAKGKIDSGDLNNQSK